VNGKKRENFAKRDLEISQRIDDEYKTLLHYDYIHLTVPFLLGTVRLDSLLTNTRSQVYLVTFSYIRRPFDPSNIDRRSQILLISH